MITDKKGWEPTLSQRIDPAHTALVVVDVQNEFAAPDGLVARGGKAVTAAQEMIERLKPLIADARKAGVFIVYIRAVYDEPVLSQPLAEQFARRDFKDSLCLTGTTGPDFVEGTGPVGLPNEVVVTKHRYSPFAGSDIDLVLRSNGIETVVLTGIVTEVCVESTARDAFFRDYRVVMATDCACPFSEAAGAASQALLNQTFGRLALSTEIRAIWNAAAAGPRNWQPEVKAANVLRTLEDRVDPAHAALVLIDVQNDFCHPEGMTAKSGAPIEMYKETVPRIRNLLLAAREAGVRVIFVKATYGQVYRNVGSPYRVRPFAPGEQMSFTTSATEIRAGEDVLANGREVCVVGTWGGQIMDVVAPQPGEQVVEKHRFSAFVDTRLDLLLRANGVKTVIMAGVTTNCCVESSARDAAMRDYYLVIAEDCVAVPDRARHLHEPSLESLRTLFGLVEPSSKIMAAWHKAKRAAAE